VKDIKQAFDNLPEDIVEYDDIVNALLEAGFTEEEIDDLIEAEAVEGAEGTEGIKDTEMYDGFAKLLQAPARQAYNKLATTKEKANFLAEHGVLGEDPDDDIGLEGDEAYEGGEVTKEALLAELKRAVEDGLIDSTDLSNLLQTGPVEAEVIEADDDEGPIKGNSLAKLIAGFKV
jgi:hypothetical protein